jgi:hypothetical protein
MKVWFHLLWLLGVVEELLCYLEEVLGLLEELVVLEEVMGMLESEIRTEPLK